LLEFGKKPLKRKSENGGETKKMNAKYKKSMKIVSLLVTALIIGTVSAATYSYLYVDGSIIIGTQKIVWLAGSDAPSGTTTDGDTAVLNLPVEADILQVFTECLYLKNQDTADHNLTVTVTTALNSGDFTIANAKIYENETVVDTWTLVDTLSLTTLDDEYSTYTGNTPLVADGYYMFTFEIQADAAATGTKSFDLTVVYE
jgi:hypothetical protein